MKIKIYSVDGEKDNFRVRFDGYKETLERSGKIDPAIYRMVFNGEVDCQNLEDVFVKFNLDIPPTHQGGSLSASDVVENENGVFFCDRVGFIQLDGFDGVLAEPMTGARVLIVEPHKPPYEATVKDDFRAIQRIVGGHFECVAIEKDIFAFCHDEGKLIGLEGNRKIGGDIIAGTFIIARDDGEGGTANLTDRQVEKYTKMFEADETYTRDEVDDSAYMEFIGF